MAVLFDPRELDRVAAGSRQRTMPMDLYRDGDHYVMNADLPGIDPGSVDVDVDGRLLTIRAERTASANDGVTWISRERRSGSFERRLRLGDGIDAEGISASYDNGVLSVVIPVSEKAKPRKITITAGSPSETVAA
jgi:HSP20 family protein